jgi:hypothetical protein
MMAIMQKGGNARERKIDEISIYVCMYCVLIATNSGCAWRMIHIKRISRDISNIFFFNISCQKNCFRTDKVPLPCKVLQMHALRSRAGWRCAG